MKANDENLEPVTQVANSVAVQISKQHIDHYFEQADRVFEAREGSMVRVVANDGRVLFDLRRDGTVAVNELSMANS